MEWKETEGWVERGQPREGKPGQPRTLRKVRTPLDVLSLRLRRAGGLYVLAVRGCDGSDQRNPRLPEETGGPRATRRVHGQES